MYNEVLGTLLIQSIGLGLVFSLISSEVLGIAAGGMVVPGYVALMMHQPFRVVGTILVALATFGLLKLLSRFAFIYGRRRIVFTVLIGFLLGWLSRQYLTLHIRGMDLELQTIGFIIPGLIANWMDRQGIVPTLAMMIIAATFVRLLLVILSGGTVGLGGTPL